MDAGVDDGVPSMTATAMLMEPRPFRPFKTSEEYLWAMKEDLADWLHSLYGLEISAENFLECLETGVTLCQHANHVRRLALNFDGKKIAFPVYEVTYKTEVVAGTFLARDNVSNFISWCRGLGIMDCLLFETEDLVMRKNERSFILCLLEVARRGAKFGMPAPMLVQMEEEIDREIEKEIQKKERMDNGEIDQMSSSSSSSQDDDDGSPPLQIITNDLKSLDEMVRDLVNRCNCPVQFPMIRVSEGKYRIGDTQVLIFVRILRSHVMVRVGGGWDTLEHYLDKHDPCRCRQGHRSTISSKLVMKHTPNQTQMQVTYERTPDPYRFGVKGQFHLSTSPPQRLRRSSLSSNPSIASKSSTGSLASTGSERERYRKSSGDGVPPSRTPDVNSRRLSDGDVYLRMTCDHLDEGYYSGSKNNPLMKKSQPQQQQQIPLAKNNNNNNNKGHYQMDSNGDSVKKCKKEPSDCSSGISTDHEAKVDSPDSGDLTDENQHEEKNKTNEVKKKGSRGKGNSKHLDQALQAINRLSRKKSQSTEELGVQMLSIPPSASTQTLRGHSTGKCNQIPSVMTRSRSQYSEDSEMSKFLNRGNAGRSSYRSPRSTPPSTRMSRATTNGVSTWAHRPRPTRPSVTMDTYTKPQAGSPSPQRRSKSGPPKTSTLHVTPNKTVLPLVQEVLTATSTREEFIRKMAEMVAEHAPRIRQDGSPDLPDDHGFRYTDDWVATTAARSRRLSGTSQSSPVDDSGSDVGDWSRDNSVQTGPYLSTGGSRIPVRVNPRKDTVPGSTRIPAPTYFNK